MRDNPTLLPALLLAATLWTPAAWGNQAPSHRPVPHSLYCGFKTRDKSSLASPDRRHDERISLINGADARHHVHQEGKPGRRRPAVSVKQF